MSVRNLEILERILILVLGENTVEGAGSLAADLLSQMQVL